MLAMLLSTLIQSGFFSPTVGDIVADNEAVIVGGVTNVPADVAAFVLLLYLSCSCRLWCCPVLNAYPVKQ